MLTSAVPLVGTRLADWAGVMDMLARFFFNLVIVITITHFFYYPKSRRRDYYFTYLVMSVSIFMMIYLMGGSKMNTGAALGLFAIFGIIRYRTEGIPIREMTYLFFIVSVSVVNAMGLNLSIAELVVANLIFIFGITVCESIWRSRKESCKFIKYDNIELIKPERNKELMADLEKRIGVKVTRVEIGSIDFLKDMTMMKVYYIDESDHDNSVNHLTKLPNETSD